MDSEVLWEVNRLKRILGAEVMGWLLFSQVSSPVWELTMTWVVISHPLYREKHKNYIPGVVHRNLILG